MKSQSEIEAIAIEVINLLTKKDITINDASHVLEQCNTIIANSTKVQEITN